MRLERFVMCLLTICILFTISVNASYVVGVGGNNWLNNSTGINTTIVQATGNIELQVLHSNYVSRWIGKNSTLDENATSGNGLILSGVDYIDNQYNVDILGDYAYVSDNSLLDVKNVTLTFWWNYSSHEDYGKVIGKMDTGSSGRSAYGIRFDNANHMSVYFVDNASNTHVYTTTSTYNTSVNRFVAIRYNGSYGSLYIDGVEVAGGSFSGSLDDLDGDFVIGRESVAGFPASRRTTGLYRDIRLYSYGMTNGELSDIENEYKYGYGDRTVNIRDAGQNNITQQIGINGTFADSITQIDLQINSSDDNFATSTGWQTVQTNATSGAMYEIPSAYQKQYYQVKAVLSTTDMSGTPIITNIRTLIGNETTISIDQEVLQEDRNNESYNLIVKFSNYTGPVVWINISWAGTESGSTYFWKYWNGTEISNQTASSNNETLWFNHTAAEIPEGKYYISEIVAATIETFIVPPTAFATVLFAGAAVVSRRVRRAVGRFVNRRLRRR